MVVDWGLSYELWVVGWIGCVFLSIETNRPGVVPGLGV